MKLFNSTLTLVGALLEGENPQPRFRAAADSLVCSEDGTLTPKQRVGFGVACARRVLPYRMQDRYRRAATPITVQTIVLENECLKATFLPDFGGKLWSLYAKDESRELLFVNPVLQPANLANRDAWTAGGIEWNLGHTGHSAFTSDALHCVKMTAPDGETFLRMYEFEATHNQVLQMDFHLPDDAKQLVVHVRIENALPTEEPLYWWTNTAVRLTEQTRVFAATPDILYQLTPSPAHPGCAFGACTMPAQPNLPGVDISLPSRIPFSIEYFFQTPPTVTAPWEVCIEQNGKGFAERSTQPLFARKLFCWGTGEGGRHWCDYLAKDGEGDYVEIQAGLAPTQVHTNVLPAEGVLSFTQLFGAFTAPEHTVTADWNAALPDVSAAMEHTIPQATVTKLDAAYAAKACLPGGEILHSGGCYGGLERLRRAKAGEEDFAAHLNFPLPAQDSVYAPWLSVLEGAALPEEPCMTTTLPYMTLPAWRTVLENAMHATERVGEQALFQYAVFLVENREDASGRQIFMQLFEENKNPWAAHALGILSLRAQDTAQAAHWFTTAYALEQGRFDPSFAEAAINALVCEGDFEAAWKLFDAILPEKRTEAMCLSAAEAAVKTGRNSFLETAFETEYATIREGAVGLAEVWWEYKARLACATQGETFTPEAIDRSLPLPHRLNFRMRED